MTRLSEKGPPLALLWPQKTEQAPGPRKNPTVSVGQASRPAIRRAALAGAKPRHPLPLKGRKERYAEKENGDHHGKDDARE